MSAELAVLAADPETVDAINRGELPALAGEAAALHARILARLVQAPATDIKPRADKAPDELLTAHEAAERLGVSRRWIYRHQDTLPFTRRLAAGTLRFSARGLERWQESRK